jgi:hypothetical protein
MRLKIELRKYKNSSSDVWKEKKRNKNNRRVTVWISIFLGIILNFRIQVISQFYILSGVFLVLIGVVFEILENSRKLREEIKHMSREQEYMGDKIAYQVKAQANINKQYIKHIVLKDDEGYDIKTWKIENIPSVLIGKESSKSRVDIDLSKTVYSSLLSREHGVLNNTGEGWFFEDLGSMNGSGVEKKDTGRKIKITPGKPIKVEIGDIIHISNTKLLLS